MSKSNLVLQDVVNHAMKKLGVSNYGGAMHIMMYPTHLADAVKELIPNQSPDNIVNRIMQGDYGPSTLCSAVLSDANAPNAPNQHSVGSISRDLALKLAHFGKEYDFSGGTIYAGFVDNPNETRFNSIMTKSKPPLIVLTEGENITGFFPINPKDKNNGDYADFSCRFNLDQINKKTPAPTKPVAPAQAPTKPVAPTQQVSTSNTAPAKPKLPTLDITKFSGVALPKSAIRLTSSRAELQHKDKEYKLVVNNSYTQETGTDYLLITLAECWTGGRNYSHRLMGKSAVDLVRKLETFLSVPMGSLSILLKETYFEDLGKSSYDVNTQKTANFLAMCPIKTVHSQEQAPAPTQAPTQVPTQNYSPIRREFLVGDRYLVVSNTLPETSKKEFYCKYDYKKERNCFFGAPVNQCGTPKEVLEHLFRRKACSEQCINQGDKPDFIIEGHKRDIQLYSKLIEILSAPETYSPIDNQSYTTNSEHVTKEINAATNRYRDFKDKPENRYSKEVEWLRENLRRVMYTHPREVTEYLEDGTTTVKILSGNNVL